MRSLLGDGTDRAADEVQPFAAKGVAALAVSVAALLAALSARYGYHRDELYFLAAGRHLAWGYVDQPPLTPALARLSADLLGGSPVALRVPSVMMAAATVAVVALIARELGAGRGGQLLAAAAAGCSGLVLAVGHLLSTETFDLLAWLVVCLLVLRLLRTGDRRWWAAVGLAVGIAMENKDLVLLLVAVLGPALLAVGPRRVLRGWWPVAGLLVALTVAGPNLWWQAQHGWPQFTVAQGISGNDGTVNRLQLVPLQLLHLSPLLVPIWIEGFRRLRRDPALRWARAMAVAYPMLCVLVLVLGGKAYYAIPPLLVLTAAGCEPVARRVGRDQRARRRAAAWLLFAAAVSAVATLPVLPPRLLSVANAVDPDQGEQIGWPALTEAVAAGWSAIPAEQRSRAVLFTENYGEAGALARYGPRYGLPFPYSGHMGFADWGPPPDTSRGPVLLLHQAGHQTVERYFTDCRAVARVDNGLGVADQEQHAPVLLCSSTTAPWSELWPKLRHLS